MNKKFTLLTAGLVTIATVASVAVFANYERPAIKAEESTYSFIINGTNSSAGYVTTEEGNRIEFTRSNFDNIAGGLGVFRGNGAAFYIDTPIKHFVSANVVYSYEGEFTPRLSLILANTSRNFQDATYQINDITSGVSVSVPDEYKADNQYLCFWYRSSDTNDENGIIIQSISVSYTC